MVKNTVTLSLAAVACSGLLISAQAPQPSTQPAQPRPAAPAAQVASQSTTITGCVYQEKDVPGRSPNIAEKAGVLEDYILAEIKPGAATATPGAAATSGQLGTMYKLEHADDSKLKALVGKRVEVSGRIDRESGDSTASPANTPTPSQADKTIGRDKVDLAEFEIASIKEVPGACPATAKP
jgi:hypothetical protein